MKNRNSAVFEHMGMVVKDRSFLEKQIAHCVLVLGWTAVTMTKVDMGSPEWNARSVSRADTLD